MKDGKEAVVWFNGPSVRQFLDIPRQPLEIGCNFIEQHRQVHHVCAFDLPVMRSIEAAGPDPAVSYWTRRKFGTPTFKTFDSPIRYKGHIGVSGFCSGTLALALALSLGATQIDLIGCDWSITNESVYDSDYTWRDRQPNKTSKDKFKILNAVSEMTRVRIVHDDVREHLGKEIVWIKPEDYRKELTISNP